MTEEEIHPWKWFGPDDSRTLIVGTFPTAPRNRSYDFFYPNTANFFWRILTIIAGSELQNFSGEQAVIERKEILRKLKVTVTDMGYKVLRNDKSSLDEKLVPVQYMDIFQILDEKPTIDKIIFTSSSGKVSSTRWFINFLTERNLRHKFPKDNKPIRSFLHHKDRQIQLVILYSTSPRAANRVSIERLVEMYRQEIVNFHSVPRLPIFKSIF